MPKALRWLLGGALVVLLVLGAVVVLPFRSWLPGGTVADLPTAAVVNGSAFNPLFPPPGAGRQLVFSQEKRGFSEARLKQDDRTLALLAISDTATAPEARDKFSTASERLQGWPLVEQGDHASALLVADRFQVKVIEQNQALPQAERREVLAAFDLKGLAALKAPKALKAAQAPKVLEPAA